MSEVRKHVHKLKRHTYKTGAKVYFCVDDCSYKVSVELSLGKRCLCWKCGKEFKLNQYSMRLAKPHCEDCHQFKGQPSTRRKTTGRRKTDLEKPTPATEFANEQARSELGDLRSRLSKLLENPPPVAVSNDEPISTSASVSTQIVEYNPNPEDDDLI